MGLPLLRTGLLICCAAVLSSCARFSHQVAPEEPHGLLQISLRDDRAGDVEYRVAKSIDGIRVPAWKPQEYRVKPGRHMVVFEEMRVVERVYAPMSVGFSTSGSPVTEEPAEVVLSDEGGIESVNAPPQAFTAGPVPVRLRGRAVESYDVRFPVVVREGYRYVLDGYKAEEIPLTETGAAR
jgi:hypothetical protein